MNQALNHLLKLSPFKNDLRLKMYQALETKMANNGYTDLWETIISATVTKNYATRYGMQLAHVEGILLTFLMVHAESILRVHDNLLYKVTVLTHFKNCFGFY